MLRLRKRFPTHWRSALAGGCVVALAGLAALLWSTDLRLLSYDLLFARPTGKVPQEAIIVHLDNPSFQELGQTDILTWNRRLHARLLDRLTADRARVVVFDIVFSSTNAPETDAELARAIRANQRVVLAAAQIESQRGQFAMGSIERAIDPLFDAAAGWGVAGFLKPEGEGDRARQYFVGDERTPSLAWAAARIAGARLTREPGPPPRTWLRYYGPALTLPHLSYRDALHQQPGYFRDKCVFIGALPKTLRATEEADAFPSPHYRWSKELFPGVEIGATAFLNLLHEDGLTEASPLNQALGIAVAGLALGFLLGLLRPWPAAAVALVAIAGTILLAQSLANRQCWWNWTVPVLVQAPLALGWSIRGLFLRLRIEKEVLSRTLEETTKLVEATRLTAQKPAQLVPDHSLIRLVGKGAYGEVWLARNAIGAFHAVKIVRRAAFPSDIPYEREFKGIQKFMPISRTHPGLVHVLHVGRNNEERCFYYIMEAGDDTSSGQKIDPETYTPKSLASELKWRGKLTPAETLRHGIALAAALEHLHQQRLIHRDIKPGNIIYVNGLPKFADIGLVTDMAGGGREVSFLGTQGYIPPEGPGSASADVYALGKVLYEAAMGRDRELFPEVPTAVYEESEDSLLRRLQQVIFKACEANPEDRYPSAAALEAALRGLASDASDRPTALG